MSEPVEQPTTLAAVLPMEPPDGSIVLAGGPAGDAWQRNDDQRWRNKNWGPNWFPACEWFDLRLGDSHRNPLTWAQFIAIVGQVHIVRWGDGKPKEVT